MLASLLSVTMQTLGKEAILVPGCIDFCHVSLFVKCNFHGTRQIALLPSVTLGKQHTASTVPANVILPSVFYRALGKYFAES